MCPSSWKLYLDYFPFFGSSLAHRKPELELFEVWEIMVRQVIIAIIANVIKLLLTFLLDHAGTDKFHAKASSAPSQVFDKSVFAKDCQLFGEEQACSRITLLVVHRHRIEWPYAQEDGC